jgi:hypothetical protein
MTRKHVFIGLAPLLAIAATAVIPAAAPAEGTHYYRNGIQIGAGKKVTLVSWGTLSFTSAEGTVTCKTAVGGYVENPTGGGAGIGVTQNFAPYECAAAECPAEARVEGIINNGKNENGSSGWYGQLVEQSGASRLETTGVGLEVGCWTAPPSGTGNVSAEERGTPVGTSISTPVPFCGTWTPKIKTGLSAGKPTKTEFGAGSGELVSPELGGLTVAGTLQTLGYAEQELIATGARVRGAARAAQATGTCFANPSVFEVQSRRIPGSGGEARGQKLEGTCEFEMVVGEKCTMEVENVASLNATVSAARIQQNTGVAAFEVTATTCTKGQVLAGRTGNTMNGGKCTVQIRVRQTKAGSGAFYVEVENPAKTLTRETHINLESR